jgi:energy-coupling factor transporter ATP-binding protein EcfA2
MNQADPSFALEVRGLTKRFKEPAVDGLNLRVRTGEFYALLGPNGAGKTTTLRMVTGLLKPDHGSITVMGIDALADAVRAKQFMAWLSDEPMIYDKLTPMEYLEFVAGQRDDAGRRHRCFRAAFRAVGARYCRRLASADPARPAILPLPQDISSTGTAAQGMGSAAARSLADVANPDAIALPFATGFFVVA